MSDIEETIERIKLQPGVDGYVICNHVGQVLRRFPAMTQATATVYAETMRTLAAQARSVVRDLDPKNELKYLRLRAKTHEVMVAFDTKFVVVVLQKWTPAATS